MVDHHCRVHHGSVNDQINQFKHFGNLVQHYLGLGCDFVVTKMLIWFLVETDRTKEIANQTQMYSMLEEETID